jgi:hypothetical protein
MMRREDGELRSDFLKWLGQTFSHEPGRDYAVAGQIILPRAMNRAELVALIEHLAVMSAELRLSNQVAAKMRLRAIRLERNK